MQFHFNCNFETKMSEAETNPDEDYNIFHTAKKKSESVIFNEGYSNKFGEGPNINLKYFKKKYDTEEEKLFMTKKIKKKKRTELCKNWEIYHDCYYKEECSFAHGEEELRLYLQISGSKNKLCRTFQEKGFCLFGKRCNYRHVLKEERLFTYQSLLKNTCKELLNDMKKSENCETSVSKLYKRILLKKKVIT